LSPLYQELARNADSLSIDERKHVQEFLNRALMFISNLGKRQSTLLRVGEAIVAHQQAFLRYGLRHLAPMTRLELAAELGLHESTVSRVVVDKTAVLPAGRVWPLSAFFTSTLCVQDVMRELVVAEPRPLSDQKLAQLLAERGFPVARRTVAKYRAQMQILPCQLR
jgi:RNA polymerase sigma-54 factor